MKYKYSVDISYYLKSNVDQKEIFAITDKYDCKWTVSDTGPFMNSSIDKYQSFGFDVKTYEDIINIIKDVKQNNKLWIDFCTKKLENNDCIHLYWSDIMLKQICEGSLNEYDENKKNFTGSDKEIHDLCMKK